MNAENVKYCDSFGIKHIQNEIRKFTGNKKIITKTYTRIRFNNVWILLFWIY